MIVGVAAITVATAGAGTFGAAAAAAAASAASSVGLASATALAGALSLGAAGLSIASELATKKPSPVVNPMAWQSDPNTGLPIAAGRTYSGGKIFLRNTSGDNNNAETIHTAYSIGPIKVFEQCYIDSVARTIDSNGNAEVNDYGKVVIATQLGAQPEVAALGFWDSTPGLSASSKVSGLAASALRLYYDAKGNKTLTTEPQFGFVIQGVRVYDPRQDSTYPGGNGAQRWNDETTWTWEGYDNPYLFGLAWLIGWRQSGKAVAGVGIPISAILVDQFVEGANVADANAWKMGGILDTTDDKWSRLKDILQAGGGVPMRLGAQVGCIVNTPKTSLAAVTVDDVVGSASVQATQAQRDRINAIVPRYMAELDNTVADPSQPADSDGNYPLITNVTWTMVAASPVVVSDYVTFDGKQRQKQIDYSFVQNLTQAQQLARYDIENAREFGPIVLPMKLRWMGYKPGDVVTCQLPELGLNGQDILILQRELSPADGTVTMTARSETFAKHAFALAQTGTAPATPSVSMPVYANPLASLYQAQLAAMINGSKPSDDLVISAALDAGGTTSTVSISAHTRIYPDSSVAVDAGTVASLALSTFYVIFYDDVTRAGGAVAYQAGTNPDDALVTSANPGRHYVGSVTTPASGATGGTSGGGASGPGGIGQTHGALP